MIDSVCKAIYSKWMNENSIELHAGSYSAIIIPKYGANVIALSNSEYNARLLRTPKDAPSFIQRPHVYGLPLLFPPNRISGGRFEYGGREYVLPVNELDVGNHLHGHLNQCSFEVEDLSANENQACAVLSFSSKSNTDFYSGIPNDFAVRVKFVLSPSGLKHTVTIINESDFPLPIGLGFHSAFSIPFINGTEVEEYKVLCSVDEHWPMDSNHNTAGFMKTESKIQNAFRQTGFDPMGDLPAQWSAKPMTYNGKPFHGAVVRNQSKAIDLVYEVSDAFKFWVFWNQGGSKGFVCMEPQTWMINAPNCGVDAAISNFSPIKSNSQEIYETRIYLRK
jgi:aldose 1-epimerase